jgi:hypothetical protein
LMIPVTSFTGVLLVEIRCSSCLPFRHRSASA